MYLHCIALGCIGLQGVVWQHSSSVGGQEQCLWTEWQRCVGECLQQPVDLMHTRQQPGPHTINHHPPHRMMCGVR